MKHFLSTILTSTFMLISIVVQAQNNNLNSFFNDHILFYSLGNFIENNDIYIYDKNKKIETKMLKYENEQNSVLRKISIVYEVPKDRKYLLLSDFIINENLAVISFVSSDKKKYITYTLKRKNSSDKWWNILSIYKGFMN